MKIVVDRNIPLVEEAFGKLGEVTALPDSEINSTAVREVDILLVRTVTRVDRHLLNGSRVRFVGSATIGTDHVDLNYLKKQGISFSSAAGCNANSVAEYMVAALLILSRRHGFSLSESTIGIVGVGNVGSRVVEKAKVLNMRILQNDPPLARKRGQSHFLPLDTILRESDILSLHVPLTYEGEDATYHMIDNNLLHQMKKSSFLINTSRGAVVDNQALLGALRSKRLSGAVLDVWEGEPEINLDILTAVDLGTPHIAGYSRDGKVNATVMIYQAVCRFLEISDVWRPMDLPPPPVPRIEVDAEGRNEEDVLSEVVGKAYDLEADDRALRGILSPALSRRKSHFYQLRNEYPVRREFNHIEVVIRGDGKGAREKLKALGFHLLS